MNRRTINVSVTHVLDPAAVSLLQRLVAAYEKMENTIMPTLDDIQSKVAAQTTVVASVQTLVQGLSQQIKDAGTDPVKLQAISDALDANDATLAKVVTDNTPAAATT